MRRISLLLISVLILAGCASQDRNPAASTFRAHLTDNIKSLDPIGINDVLSLKVGAQIYEGLLTLDESGGLKPMLAQEWTSPDGQLWTFHLREDAFFQDDTCFPSGKGRGLSAEDVKFSFERVVRKDLASAGAWIFLDIVEGARDFHEGTVDEVAGFRVLDSRTFQIRLTRPYPPFLYRLLTNYAWIVAPEAVEHYGREFGSHPVGTAPFKLEENVLDGHVSLLHRLPASGDGQQREFSAGQIDRLVFRIVKDPVIALNEFLAGRLSELEVPLELLPRVFERGGSVLRQEFSGYQHLAQPGLNWHFIGINMATSPLGGTSRSARLLRQALQFGVNRKAISEGPLFGGAVPLTRVFPPGVDLSNPDLSPISYDPQRAKSLLAEAGHPEGRGLPVFTVAVQNTEEARTVMAQVQSYWEALGIRTEFRQYDFPTLVDLVFSGRSPLTLLFIDAIDPHPEYFVQFFLEHNPFNFFNYANPKVNDLFHETFGTGPGEFTGDRYRLIESLIIEDSPWIFLHVKKNNILLQPEVQNYRLDPLGRLQYGRVRLAP